jgi:hypothetical protein
LWCVNRSEESFFPVRPDPRSSPMHAAGDVEARVEIKR